jgi:flagellar hook-length control protein FliK
VKSDGKEENQTAKADASSAALANPTDAVRVNANQPSPNVAAIAAPTTAAASPIDGSAGADAKSAKSSATLKSTSLSAFGRFDRDGLLTSSGPRQAGESQDAPTVDPARFVGRVARAIETAQERGGPINLRLSPPELGSMRIELSLKDGVMNAKVETETASARQALLDNLPALRDKLANQNVRIERFEVDVRRDAQGDQSNRGPQQRQFQQQQQQHYQSRSARPATAATGGIEGLATEPTSAVRTITDTTINLVA